MDIEMETIRTNGDHVAGRNGDSVAVTMQEATETDVLLSVQTGNCNGEKKLSDQEAEPQGNLGNTSAEATSCNGETFTAGNGAESQRNGGRAFPKVRCIKKELNEKIFWKVRLWMAIIFIFLLIIAVILISLLVCSAIHVDKDETFDRSVFKFPLYFNGSFQLPNMVYTEELITLSFNKSQTLAADLQGKLADLYTSSLLWDDTSQGWRYMPSGTVQ